MENYIIDQVDIDNFKTACLQLRNTLEMIRYYVPSAHIYVTPNQINLMVGYGDCVNSEVRKNADEDVVESIVIPHMDCGDW